MKRAFKSAIRSKPHPTGWAMNNNRKPNKYRRDIAMARIQSVPIFKKVQVDMGEGFLAMQKQLVGYRYIYHNTAA